MKFWEVYWSVLTIVMLLLIAVPDIIAVTYGHKMGVGDKFTYTHWLVVHVGLSVIGLFIGYLFAHFLVVHRNG